MRHWTDHAFTKSPPKLHDPLHHSESLIALVFPGVPFLSEARFARISLRHIVIDESGYAVPQQD